MTGKTGCWVQAAMLVALAFAAPASANDSTAQLGAGGLELVRNEAVALRSEDLFVSADEIRVSYRFRNITDALVTFLVAFPLPPVDATVPEEANFVLPDRSGTSNFTDFAVTIDGQPVTPSIEERVSALGVDQTARLRALGLPLNPLTDGIDDLLEKLPPETLAELNRLGLVLVDDYAKQAAWKLETTFYWTQTFPPQRDVIVEHRYKPVIGYGFFGREMLSGDYRTTYCLDRDFIAPVGRQLAAIADAPMPYLQEQRIDYILTTANNWSGPIGVFRLVVDKGTPDSFISFCGTDIRKIGPTQFEMTATDFVPEQDLAIVIVRPVAE